MPHDKAGRLKRYDHARQEWEKRQTIGRVVTVMPGSETCNVIVVHLAPSYWPLKQETITANDTELVLKADGSEVLDEPVEVAPGTTTNGRLGELIKVGQTSIAVLALGLVLAAPALAADAPAPRPSPRPRAVSAPAPHVAEPLDLAPVDVPGEPQPDSLTLEPAPAPPVTARAAPPADDPQKNPCGTLGAERWCTQLDTGYVGVVTRGEKQDYLTGGVSFTGPLGRENLILFLRAELMGVQDGGRLNFSNPQSFRAVTTEASLGRSFQDGQLGIALRGATTFSVEGLVAAPIDPRLWTGRLEVAARFKLATIRARGGHEGTVGGWAVGGDLEIPIPGSPSLVTSYDYPLSRPNPAMPLPWVLTAGARATFGRFRLSSLFQ